MLLQPLLAQLEGTVPWTPVARMWLMHPVLLLQGCGASLDSNSYCSESEVRWQLRYVEGGGSDSPECLTYRKLKNPSE